MGGRYQRALHIMGLELRARLGTPRSQQDNNLDVDAGSGAGSVSMIQGGATTDDQGRPSGVRKT
eukprot:3133196-Prorocentrum_lima.AAC.1